MPAQQHGRPEQEDRRGWSSLPGAACWRWPPPRGCRPMNMPRIRVSDRLSKPANLAPITRQPGMVSRMLPNTMARPAPLPCLGLRQQPVPSAAADAGRRSRAPPAPTPPGRSWRLRRLEMARSWLSFAPARRGRDPGVAQPSKSSLPMPSSARVGRGPNGGGARAAAQQRHLAERLAGVEAWPVR